MRPPIPEPHGSEGDSRGNWSILVSNGLSVHFRATFASLARKSIKELWVTVSNILMFLTVSTVTTSILFPATLWIHHQPPLFELTVVQLWILSLCAYNVLCVLLLFFAHLFQRKREQTVVLTPYGIAKRDKSKVVELQWSSYFWIVLWSGDVLLCTFATVTFIPREVFKSTQEAQEFVQIARELHKSCGAAWLDEWKGKIFGRTSES